MTAATATSLIRMAKAARDAAFDGGFVTFADDGRLLPSAALDPAARPLLGLGAELRLEGLTAGHRKYLMWHRERVFRR